MDWQKIPVDFERYRQGLELMMEHIRVPVHQGIETGLGWGVSARVFLHKFPAASLLSVDIQTELEAMTKLHMMYPGRFEFAPPQIAKLTAEPCQWLYIDGDHTYAGVMADIEKFEPFLVPGGVIAFDDYSTRETDPYHYPEVKQAVHEFLLRNADRFSLLRCVSSPTAPAFALKTR